MSETAVNTIRAAADTVQNAIDTPEREQPYAALGMKADEYAKVREILGRRPTSGEQIGRASCRERVCR